MQTFDNTIRSVGRRRRDPILYFMICVCAIICLHKTDMTVFANTTSIRTEDVIAFSYKSNSEIADNVDHNDDRGTENAGHAFLIQPGLHGMLSENPACITDDASILLSGISTASQTIHPANNKFSDAESLDTAIVKRSHEEISVNENTKNSNANSSEGNISNGETVDDVRIDSVEGTDSEEFAEASKSTEQHLNRENIQETPNHNICESDGVSQRWVDAVNCELALIPDNVMSAFNSSGWHLYCTSKNLDEYFYDGRFGAVMGVSDYTLHNIWIENRTVAVKEGVVHEMGHFIDYNYGFISGGSEFDIIYKEESEQFLSYFGLGMYWDKKEFFAEGFYRYTKDPDGCRTAAPKLYAFIRDISLRFPN